MTSKPSLTQSPVALVDLLANAKFARNASNWTVALRLYSQALALSPKQGDIHHNIALCFYALGKYREAGAYAKNAIELNPQLWQSHIILARALKGLGQMEAADLVLARLLQADPANGQARVARADLAINEFGEPLAAIALVQPLLHNPQFSDDAELTTLMASLYDRDISAGELNQKVLAFSQRVLQLPGFSFRPRPERARGASSTRPRVALLSPLFCVSPVYFLTIAGFRHVAEGSDIVVFNRGSKQDWATEQFRAIAAEWHDVQHISAPQLAQAIYDADIDVLYDLGGWMDSIGLRALSAKPARKQFKWVGGQSITTGLSTFDGWIGDEHQSPTRLQHLYTEPLINVDGGYATYTPAPYMPKPAARKRDVPVIFANPAKVSRAFLQMLKQRPGKKVFLHRQYGYARVRERIESVLDASEVEYVCPGSHQEALEVLNQHKLMIDTFPYSGGLTAREARALGVKVETRVGELFCERHGAGF